MVPMTLGGGSSGRRAGVTASTAGPRALGAHGGPAGPQAALALRSRSPGEGPVWDADGGGR